MKKDFKVAIFIGIILGILEAIIANIWSVSFWPIWLAGTIGFEFRSLFNYLRKN